MKKVEIWLGVALGAGILLFVFTENFLWMAAAIVGSLAMHFIPDAQE